MPRRRRIKTPPRTALSASDLESIMMEMLRGLKSCAKLQSRAGRRLAQSFARDRKSGEAPRAGVRENRRISKGSRLPAIDGLIKEADGVTGEVDDKKVLDAAIIGSAQAVEHYEISRYGTLIAWAEELGHDEVTRLLNANLREENAADRKPTRSPKIP
jgi:ferritin-like metal-binding protein YciE